MVSNRCSSSPSLAAVVLCPLPLPGRQGQGLAPAHPGQLRQGPVQAGRRQQRGRVAPVAPAQAARRPRRHPRLGRRRGQGRQPVRRHRRRGQGLQGDARRQGRRSSTPATTARSSAWPWRRTARSTPAPGPAARSSASIRDGKAKVVYDSRREPTSGRWPSTPRARRSTPAPGRKGRIYRITPGRQGQRLLHDQAGPHPVPGARAPTARSTPAPTRAAWSTASTARARASCSTRRRRPRCAACW